MSKRYLLFLVCVLSTNIFSQKTDFATVNFKNAEENAKQWKGENLHNLPKLAYDLTYNLSTDVEKFRAIYLWICSNVANDYDLFVENKKMRKKYQKDQSNLIFWNEKFSKKVFQKLRKEKKTICTGYAYLLKELLGYVQIESEVINGYGRTTEENVKKLGNINHSWNAVKINNKWYLCDATWASGIYNVTDYKFDFQHNDGYFLADPKLFAKTHFPEDSYWLLSANNFQITDFINGPILYEDTFRVGLNPEQPKTILLLLKKGDAFKFLLNPLFPIALENLRAEISSGNFKSVEQPNCRYLNNGWIELKYVFKNTGFYDFHIKMLDNYLVTYTVKVTNNNIAY